MGEVDEVVSLYKYEGRAAEAVRRLKYSRRRALARPMAQLLAEALTDLGENRFDFILPVPIHWMRRAERGFNQAELLCGYMPPGRVRTDLLKRTRATPPQVTLSAQERRTSLQTAFAAASEVKGGRVLLVDDVVTTGSTLLWCAYALRQAGAVRVEALTFCGETHPGQSSWGGPFDPEEPLPGG